MERVSRRDFLKGTSNLAVAAATLGRARIAYSSEPHIEFPADSRERIAVASYPFRDFIAGSHHSRDNSQQPLLDIKDFGTMVVDKFHVRNIEPWSRHIKSADPGYLAGLRATFDKSHVRVVNIPADIAHSVYDPDAAARSAAVNEGKAWVDAAVALGSPSVRIHIAGVRGVPPDVGRAAQSLSQIADYGAQKNVVVNLENDDLVSEDAFFVVKVIEKVDNPFLHALPDFGNSMMTGNADFNYRAVTAMFDHAYNIAHVKEGEDDDSGKFVPVNVPKTFEIAKNAGYRGYFSIEMDSKGDPYAGTRKLVFLSLMCLG